MKTAVRSAQAYIDYVYRRMQQGGWSPFFRDDAVTLGVKSAAVISHLLNNGKLNCDEDGWIPCTVRFLQNGLGLDAEQQERVLTRLKRFGVIEVANRNGIRSVRIDTDRLDRLREEGD